MPECPTVHHVSTHFITCHYDIGFFPVFSREDPKLGFWCPEPHFLALWICTSLPSDVWFWKLYSAIGRNEVFIWFSLGHHLHQHPLVCEARWPCQISGPCQPCHRHITRTRTHHLFEFETTYSFVLYRIASLCTYLYPCLAPVLWFSFHILLYWYPVLFYPFRQAWWPSSQLGFTFFAYLGNDTNMYTHFSGPFLQA